MLELNKNVVAAGLVFAFGASFAGYAVLTMPLGTFAAMGPGMFPACVGALMAMLGVLMLLAERRPARAAVGAVDNAWEPIEWRSLVAVLASMSAFAVTIPLFGVVPAIFTIVGIAALGSDRLRPATILALASALSVFAWLVFTVALKLPLPLLKWPL